MGKAEIGQKCYLLFGTWALFLLTWAFVVYHQSFNKFENSIWSILTTKLKAESCLAVISLFFGLMTVTFGLLSKNKMICMITSGLFFACAVASMGIGTSVLADTNSNASVYLKTHEFWFGWIGILFAMFQAGCSLLLPSNTSDYNYNC